MREYMVDIAKRVGNFTADRLLPAVLVLVIGIFVIRLVMRLIDQLLSKTKLETTALRLVRSFIRAALYVILFLIAAPVVGINVSSLVALASVLTLAISLSVQNALTNMFGGFSLLYTKPFVAGDFVEIAGRSGKVEEVGLTYTRLVTPDNKLISIPNSAVVATDIVNYTATGMRRVDITVTASYDAPAKQVIAALLKAAEVPGVLADPAPFAALDDYGESSIQYVLRVWSTTDAYWDTMFAVKENIKVEFDKAGVEMNYPHLNVHVDSQNS